MYFEHYKGNLYEVIGHAKHTETLECLVVYKDIEGKIWTRPIEMFYGDVVVEVIEDDIVVDTIIKKRFTPIKIY